MASILSLGFSSSSFPLMMTLLVVLLLSLGASRGEEKYNWTRKELRVAWLAPREMNRGFSASTSVNALKVSLRIAEKQYIVGHTIRAKWFDTGCTPKAALTAAVDARRDFDPDLFLGPPCSEGMSGVAMLASHWNIPIFGWVSNSHELRDRHIYSTLIRVLGPLNKFSNTMTYIKKMFNWSRFSMIYDTDTAYRSVHNAIASTLRKPGGGNVVTSTHGVNADKPDVEVENIFRQIKKYARVIVLSVPWLSMRRYMLVAHNLSMTSGDFAFICINSDVGGSVQMVDMSGVRVSKGKVRYGQEQLDAGLRDLHQSAKDGAVHIIADEANAEVVGVIYSKLQERGVIVRMWAAGVELTIPDNLKKKVRVLREPLRCPRAVTEEVQQARHIKVGSVPDYNPPSATRAHDGFPPHVIEVDGKVLSEEAGRRLGEYLVDTLRVGARPPGGQRGLRFQDVFVLGEERSYTVTDCAPVARGLQQRGVPARHVPRCDEKREETAAWREWVGGLAAGGGGDEVAVTEWHTVVGLERPVVVWLDEGVGGLTDLVGRLHAFSRSTATLIIVRGTEHEYTRGTVYDIAVSVPLFNPVF